LYDKEAPQIVVEELEHIGSYSAEEWIEKLRKLKNSNEMMIGIATSKNIHGSIIVEDNMIYFFSNNGNTVETFIFTPCKDGEKEKLLNEETNEYWEKCDCRAITKTSTD
jgi:hypothetical protein